MSGFGDDPMPAEAEAKGKAKELDQGFKRWTWSSHAGRRKLGKDEKGDEEA